MRFSFFFSSLLSSFSCFITVQIAGTLTESETLRAIEILNDIILPLEWYYNVSIVTLHYVTVVMQITFYIEFLSVLVPALLFNDS